MADNFPIPHTSYSGYVLAFFPAITAVTLGYYGVSSGRMYLAYIAAAPMIVCALLLYMGYASNHIMLSVSATDVAIKLPLSATTIPKSAIKRDEAKQVNLREHPELVPVHRTNGVEMGDFKQGWWKLRNGDKALVVITDDTNVVYLPTTQGYSVLVTPPRAAEFLEHVKQ